MPRRHSWNHERTVLLLQSHKRQYYNMMHWHEPLVMMADSERLRPKGRSKQENWSTRPNFSQFHSLKIHRSTNFMKLRNGNRRSLQLYCSERVGRVSRVISPFSVFWLSFFLSFSHYETLISVGSRRRSQGERERSNQK